MRVGRQKEAEPFFLVSVGHQRLLKLTLLAQICCLTLGPWEAAPDLTELPVFSPQQVGTGWQARLKQSSTTGGAGVLIMEAEAVSERRRFQLIF